MNVWAPKKGFKEKGAPSLAHSSLFFFMVIARCSLTVSFVCVGFCTRNNRLSKRHEHVFISKSNFESLSWNMLFLSVLSQFLEHYNVFNGI